ncbi:thymidine phosphorylase family protein [Leisingera methylohalidivorans]|uniref:Putative thymidine phosphorylase n=1 Tax=Leisingera methylohalidivorans DSM 14336 TaxID=999552 RepID=V9W0Y1_9RHOB|nr:thymidine phosphorylase family protein [Leisingera methylohalidivorans]AHD03659.1 thymidine phosphorylase [Leisingera methylohalidivorans DSM 14336]
MNTSSHSLRLMPAGIDTYSHPVVYMHADCHVCQAEGFRALTRVRIDCGRKWVIATLNVVTGGCWLPPDAAALSDAAWQALQPGPGALGRLSHPEPPAAASFIRAKVYGERLAQAQFNTIIGDALARRLSDLDLAAFVTACSGDRLDFEETIALTRAMQAAGKSLNWGKDLVLDKHCVGGLPGNRTTPIVVAVVAAAGHIIPKTSSRAITSPAGTADVMEVMAPVELDLTAMRRVVETQGGCVVWGGGLRLSPADDALIRIERPLDFDSDGLIAASVLSKKAAAGADRVIIDIPVGTTAKVRSSAAAAALSARLNAVAAAVGLELKIHISDGSRPVGRGIGPALEAADVLKVLRRDPDAPADLRERALTLAGLLLELGGAAGTGPETAAQLLDSGAAEQRFMAICEAQGGFREPETAAHRTQVTAADSGTVTAIDNRLIARIAKLAGAPQRARAGVLLLARPGDRVQRGGPLFEIHSETPGELAYAQDYAARQPGPFSITELS